MGPTHTKYAGVDKSDVLDDLLTRHEKYDPDTRSRTVAEVLMHGDWEIYPHENYVRLEYPGKVRRVKAYLRSNHLNFPQADDAEFVLTLPGGEEGKKGAHLSVREDKVNETLINLSKIEAWADK